MLLDLLHRYARGRYRSLGFKSFALETRSARLHYLVRELPGSTRTIVLVHGLGTSSSTWLRILPHLKERVRIVAPDLPGFGFSTVRGENGYCSVGEHEEALSFLVHNIAQGPVTLLGQSFGGWISALYAARHPQRVAHLILVNTAGVYYRGVEKLREIFTVSSVKETRRLLDSLWYHYPWYFRPFAGSVFRELSKRRMSDLVQSIDATDFLVEELGALTMPVSIIWGMEDRVISSECVNVLQKFVPQAKFFPIDRCGHVPQLERPAEFVSILHRILQE
jgi:abhydrolase domain-containing protein 6